MKEFFDNIYMDDKEDLLMKIKSDLKKDKKNFIITANPETFMYGEKNKTYGDMLLNKDNIIVADGIGIIKGSKKLKKKTPNKITGIDLTYEFLKMANDLKKNVFLFGATAEVLKALKDKINKEYPNINLVGIVNGYDCDKDTVVNNIIKTKPDFIFVALGIPKQELFINECYKKSSKGIFMGVGGSFDVISGNKKRAPKLFINLNLEWLYRIIKEPKRIKRFYENNIKFLFKL